MKRNFFEKPRKAKKFVEVRLRYFCTILYLQLLHHPLYSSGVVSNFTATNMASDDCTSLQCFPILQCMNFLPLGRRLFYHFFLQDISLKYWTYDCFLSELKVSKVLLRWHLKCFQNLSVVACDTMVTPFHGPCIPKNQVHRKDLHLTQCTYRVWCSKNEDCMTLGIGFPNMPIGSGMYTNFCVLEPSLICLRTIKASNTQTPTHGLASTLCMRTAISPGQW